MENVRVGASNFGYSGFEDMLLDEDRNSKYQKAIELAVEKKLKEDGHAHVLDIGSGTGLLSLYAAKAGATTVTSIELDPVIYEVSVKIAKRAGFSNLIRFINVESSELDELPQKANVLISEIFDSELLGENVLRTFEHALQTLTTPNVICIPERANVYVVPIESRLLAQQCQLPSTFKTNCNGNLSGIDSHWLTSGNKTFDSVCKPILLKSFKFNDLNSLCFQDTIKQDFIVEQDVRQIDGVLLWWDLDLIGDGKYIISTGGEHHKPKWRNHWLPVAYGLPTSLSTNLNDTFQLIGSHDEVSFWLDIHREDSKLNYNKFMERRECTCQWHLNMSPSSFLHWNTNYDNSQFVDSVIKETVDKTVVCIGLHSRLSTILKAKKLIVVEMSQRFCDQISQFCASNSVFVQNIDKIECWNETDIVVFDLYPNNFSSPTELASQYYSIVNKHKNIKILPEKLELQIMAVKFENLWRRKMRVTQIDEFDYTDFDECFGKSTEISDDELELLPLWEEQCYARSDPLTLFDYSNNEILQSHEIPIPNDSDAFVFYFTLTSNNIHEEPFTRQNEGKIEWKEGLCQWIYFLTRPESTKINIEFKKHDQKCPSLIIKDE